MDILRHIVASRKSSLEVETVYGVPITLAVDLDNPDKSWTVDIRLSPSTELKLKSGVYGTPGEGLLKRPEMHGKPMSFSDFTSWVWFVDPAVKRLDSGRFYGVDEDCLGKVVDWLKDSFSKAKGYVDIDRLKGVSSPDDANRMGTCSLGKMMGVSIYDYLFTFYSGALFDHMLRRSSLRFDQTLFQSGCSLDDFRKWFCVPNRYPFSREDAVYIKECLER